MDAVLLSVLLILLIVVMCVSLMKYTYFGYSVAMSADGSRIAVGSPDGWDQYKGRVRVFDQTPLFLYPLVFSLAYAFFLYECSREAKRSLLRRVRNALVPPMADHYRLSLFLMPHPIITMIFAFVKNKRRGLLSGQCEPSCQQEKVVLFAFSAPPTMIMCTLLGKYSFCTVQLTRVSPGAVGIIFI
jgi:hypothetical protein